MCKTVCARVSCQKHRPLNAVDGDCVDLERQHNARCPTPFVGETVNNSRVQSSHQNAKRMHCILCVVHRIHIAMCIKVNVLIAILLRSIAGQCAPFLWTVFVCVPVAMSSRLVTTASAKVLNTILKQEYPRHCSLLYFALDEIKNR